MAALVDSDFAGTLVSLQRALPPVAGVRGVASANGSHVLGSFNCLEHRYTPPTDANAKDSGFIDSSDNTATVSAASASEKGVVDAVFSDLIVRKGSRSEHASEPQAIGPTSLKTTFVFDGKRGAPLAESEEGEGTDERKPSFRSWDTESAALGAASGRQSSLPEIQTSFQEPASGSRHAPLPPHAPPEPSKVGSLVEPATKPDLPSIGAIMTLPVRTFPVAPSLYPSSWTEAGRNAAEGGARAESRAAELSRDKPPTNQPFPSFGGNWMPQQQAPDQRFQSGWQQTPVAQAATPFMHPQQPYWQPVAPTYAPIMPYPAGHIGYPIAASPAFYHPQPMPQAVYGYQQPFYHQTSAAPVHGYFAPAMHPQQQQWMQSAPQQLEHQIPSQQLPSAPESVAGPQTPERNPKRNASTPTISPPARKETTYVPAIESKQTTVSSKPAVRASSGSAAAGTRPAKVCYAPSPKTPGSSRQKKSSHSCYACSRTFGSSSQLARHRRIHMDVKPFECWVEGCGARFCRVDNMKSHATRHEARVCSGREPSGESQGDPGSRNGSESFSGEDDFDDGHMEGNNEMDAQVAG